MSTGVGWIGLFGNMASSFGNMASSSFGISPTLFVTMNSCILYTRYNVYTTGEWGFGPTAVVLTVLTVVTVELYGPLKIIPPTVWG